MCRKRSLVIDIGTNSTLALLAKVEGETVSVISDRKVTTRLGEGLSKTGRLSKEAMERTARAVSRFINEDDCDSRLIIGTEALRRAENSSEFAKLLKKNDGIDLTVISGETEAELSFLGAFYNLDIDREDVLLADVGGGSTELVLGSYKEIVHCVSTSVGALILKETAQEDYLDKYIMEAESILTGKIETLLKKKIGTFIATGGTITSATAVFLQLDEYDASKVHGMSLSVDNLREIGERFEKLSIIKRKTIIPFDMERAEIILPGLGIFLAIMGVFKINKVVISNGGLRFGAVLRPDLVVTR